MVLLSAITYALYVFGSGWLIPKFGIIRFPSYVMIVSSILIITQFMVEFKMNVNVLIFPKEVHIYGLLITLFSTVIPSFLISYAIKKLGANQFSIFDSMGTISTIMLAYLFLEERLISLQLLGSIIVMMSVFTAEYFKKDPKT